MSASRYIGLSEGNASSTASSLQAFSCFYEALSACFHYPRRKFVVLVVSNEIGKLFRRCASSISACPRELVQGLELIEDYEASAKERGVESIHRELAMEYTRLFINAYPLVPCPPYESFYVDGGFLAQRSAMEVLDLYAKAGYHLSPRFKDLPDHVAVELEFMSILCRSQLRMLEEKGREDVHFNELAQLRSLFVKEHLVKWIPSFCRCVEKHSKVGFYRGAAWILRALVDMEAEG